MRDALPELVGQGLMARIEEVLATGQPYGSKEWQLGASYFDFTYQPTRGRDGGIDGVMMFATDVTAQVLARRRLEESEERFRFLADMVPALIWTSRPDGTSDYYNARWSEYTGLTPEQLLEAWDIIHPDDLPGLLEQWSASRETGSAYRVEARMRDRAGLYRWFINSAVPLHDSRGKVVKWFGTCIDIDEQKRTQQALERAGEFREQLLGIVGHDLRNPLASITIAAATMLKRGALGEADARIAARIAASANRMARIIDRVLDFTRSRLGGGLSITRSQVDLAEVCHQVIEELEIAQPSSTISLSVEGDTAGEWDGQRIGQVVSNLVSNALEHGGPQRVVSVALRGAPAGIELSVHNDGVPIPPDLLPLVFEPFRSSKGGKGNLGLGLYIVRQIASAHGGGIAVHSTACEGTTFTLRLPRAHPG